MTSQGKWVLITGGGKGIGRAISNSLYQSGYSLILAGRDLYALEAVASELAGSSRERIQALACDLSTQGSARRLLEEIQAKGIPFPQHLVCNAGDYGVLGPLSEVDIEEWKKSFDLNFFSVAELIQQFVRASSKQPTAGDSRRKIILLSGSGLGGSQVWAGISAYGCAKAALYRLMEVVHKEIFNQGFDINCIAPGAVKTGITDQAERAGASALGALYDATLKVKKDGGDSPLLAAETVVRLLSPGCDRLSGRLISAKWDQKVLEDPSVVLKDRDLLRLRRIDNELFKKV